MSKRRRRIRPLLNISGEWDGTSRTPVRLNVAMDNGTYVRYVAEIPMPRPYLLERNRGNIVVGYKFNGLNGNKKPTALTGCGW